MNFLGAGAANIGPEHNSVCTVAMHIFLVEIAGEDLGVSSTAVNVLFVFHGELDNEGFAFIAERLVKFGGCSIKFGVL